MSKLPITGIVLLDKPEGLSSNHALQKVKRLYHAEKAGHAGTLDPMATGMLPICLGRATKLSEYLLDADKCYRATISLGSATNTGDKTGEIIETAAVPAPFVIPAKAGIQSSSLDSRFRGNDLVTSVLEKFTGKIEQIPPMYSALKHEGQRLYKLARKGHEVERQPRPITIYRLQLIEFIGNELTIEVECSKGTYIRVLGEDIAKALGTVGHLSALRRLYSAGLEYAKMVSLEVLQQSNDLAAFLMPIESFLLDWPSVEISPQQLETLYHGKPLRLEVEVTGRYKLICQSKLTGIADCQAGEIIERKLI
ncbi:MAG: tRNA pseudouridine(55) synthase TruB [Gammaproteobacteria bacterium]|nr:tRNA pseudouridine(55) synthase TruB [Gammaproteobacteria bacterium]